MNVLCTIVIFLSPGQRDVVQLRGVVLNDNSDKWLVDFSKEFIKRKYSTEYQTMVQKVNGNACLYTTK